jgi:hypothetical protein
MDDIRLISPSVSNESSRVISFEPSFWDELQVGFKKLREHPWYPAGIKIFFLFLYFLIGCAVYTSYEGWSVGTAILFSLITITTIGKFVYFRINK